MNKILTVVCVFICFPLVAQTKYNPQYFEAIGIIKSSEEYKQFCEEHYIKKDLEISQYNYSICEYDIFLTQKINSCDSNWLELDVPKNKDLQKIGVNGKINAKLMFTQV